MKTLYQRRIDSGTNLSTIAADLAISPMTIYRIERGEQVGAHLIVDYCRYMQIPPATGFRLWTDAYDERSTRSERDSHL